MNAVAFSPGGTRLLSGSEDHTLKLWDAATGLVLNTFDGHTESVHAVAFSPDGTRVLSGSDDKTLKLWDAATGQLLQTLAGHTEGVYSVAFSPDGTRALSGGEDMTWCGFGMPSPVSFCGRSRATRTSMFSQLVASPPMATAYSPALPMDERISGTRLRACCA